ncbi:MAG TPA: glycosyltransferase family 4 protein [Anaerolineales bacterium]|nr:glycosyltransferase family 4 protein [Anaerolineales bacterium]
MHILLIHQAFAALDEPGGTRHHELSRYLTTRGHRVTIIASPVSYLTGAAPGSRAPWAERRADGSGITVLRTYTYPALHRSFAHRVISFLSFMVSSFFVGLTVKQVDLIWGTSPPIFQGVTAWVLARLKRTPFLFEVRDLWPAFAVEVGVLRQPLLIRASEWLERVLYNHADLVMVNSPGFIEHVRARGAARVELVPNGADSAMFDPQADGKSLKQDWGLSGRFVALYAGAHGISNDLRVLLQAADRLRAFPEIALVLLGDGKEKPALMTLAAEMHLPNVFFLPPLPKNAIPSALAAADACIAILKPIPMYATVYPNKVFDYMAAGRPVILAIDGVIREVVEGSAAGVYVPPGDPQALAEAIQYLATHQQEAREMGLHGRQTVEDRFDRSVLAGRLARLMEQMVNKV